MLNANSVVTLINHPTSSVPSRDHLIKHFLTESALRTWPARTWVTQPLLFRRLPPVFRSPRCKRKANDYVYSHSRKCKRRRSSLKLRNYHVFSSHLCHSISNLLTAASVAPRFISSRLYQQGATSLVHGQLVIFAHKSLIIITCL